MLHKKAMRVNVKEMCGQLLISNIIRRPLVPIPEYEHVNEARKQTGSQEDQRHSQGQHSSERVRVREELADPDEAVEAESINDRNEDFQQAHDGLDDEEELEIVVLAQTGES
jgi:hypothetical protein